MSWLWLGMGNNAIISWNHDNESHDNHTVEEYFILSYHNIICFKLWYSSGLYDKYYLASPSYTKTWKLITLSTKLINTIIIVIIIDMYCSKCVNSQHL